MGSSMLRATSRRTTAASRSWLARGTASVSNLPSTSSSSSSPASSRTSPSPPPCPAPTWSTSSPRSASCTLVQTTAWSSPTGPEERTKNTQRPAANQVSTIVGPLFPTHTTVPFQDVTIVPRFLLFIYFYNI